MKKDMLLLFMLATSVTAISQNVGIGTTTPVDKLSVVTGVGYGITHEAIGIKLGTFIDANGGWVGTQSAHPFYLFTGNGLAQMTIQTDGNVGINTTSPQFKLDIKGRMRVQTSTIGNIFTTPGIWFDDYRDGSNRIFFGMQDSIRLGIWGEGTPGAGWAFNFNARNGNVGIGIAAPVNKLEVGGNISATGNLTANSFQFNTPKTCYLSIGGADFLPDEVNYYTITPYSAYLNSLGSNLYAPVHLPHGAVVTEMKVVFFDYQDPTNLTVYLMRIDENSGISTNMAQIASSGYSSARQTLSDNTITDPVVDNTTYLYSIRATTEPDNWGGFGIKVHRVQITYTISQAN